MWVPNGRFSIKHLNVIPQSITGLPVKVFSALLSKTNVLLPEACETRDRLADPVANMLNVPFKRNP